MIRNRPVQQRSQALLERIMHAAGEMFDEYGVEGCSTEQIARHAGASIGAVYRFFPNKASLAADLAERYALQQQAAAIQHFEEANLARPAEEIVGEFFESFADLLGSQLGWRGLMKAGYLFNADSGHAPPAASHDWDALLERFFQAQVPQLAADERRIAARMFVSLTAWLLLRVAESTEPLDVGLREARTVMVGYIQELRRRC